MSQGAERFRFRIHGMDCAEEVTLLKRELLPLVHNEDRLGFDLLNGKLTVNASTLDVTQIDVLAAIERTGLQAELWQDVDQTRDGQSFWQRNQRSILTAASGVSGLVGLMLQLTTSVGHSVTDGGHRLCIASVSSRDFAWSSRRHGDHSLRFAPT